MKEHDEIRVKWRESVGRGRLQAHAGQMVDGEEVFRKADKRIKQRGRKRALMTPRFVFTEEAETQLLESLGDLADESESAAVRVRDGCERLDEVRAHVSWMTFEKYFTGTRRPTS